MGEGSEHKLENTSFPLEMHLVHYRSDFSSIKEALVKGDRDSLAVLAVLFEVSSQPNVGLENLMPFIEDVIEGDETEVTPFSLRTLIEGDLTTFYRYDGSLTTPDCNEIVQEGTFVQYRVLTTGRY